jgi:hypothetical protein
MFITGQAFSHKPQFMHLDSSTWGYQKPSISVLKEIACLGQMSPQALQPQHFDLSEI